MSPRSEEFIEAAKEALTGARAALDAGAPSRAVSSAYYAMFNAARAALSERDENARTHSGIWHLFHERFVATGAFDPDLHALARRAEGARIQADYEAAAPSADEARELVEGAERFLGAVEAMLAD